MIVVDASAAVAALLNNGPARRMLATETLHSPHLIDVEVASSLRRQVKANRVGAAEGWNALDTWRHLGIARYSMQGLLERVWELRDNVSSYDACYIALAESLECPMITADARLSNAPGIRCPVTVVPH